jgi:GTPase SAR1 family protein
MNLASAKKFIEKMKKSRTVGGEYYFVAAGTGFAAISVVLFGTLFFLVLSIIHIIFLGIFFIPVYLFFIVIKSIDKVYRVKNKIFTPCPACHYKTELPAYLCPKCGIAHNNLVPNRYGIIKRICICGEKLPTSFFSGRTTLKAKCIHCGYGIETEETTPICIPIIGGPSVGKTCYLFAATHSLIENIAPKYSWKTPFLNTQNKELYLRVLQDFNRGIVPAKTTELTPKAFNFFIKSNEWSPGKILYFYDAAGEAFQNSKELLSHRFYGYLHGFLFIIDPFSIPGLINQYQDNLKLHHAGIRPSAMVLEEAFDIMLINLEKNHKIRRNERITQPFAVVINKIDVFDLEDRIGHRAVKKYLAQHREVDDFKQAEDLLCKEVLKTWGLGNFLRKLEQKFEHHHFFTCSALGRIPEGNNNKYVPSRVGEPLLWLLGKASKNLKVQSGDTNPGLKI